MDTGATYISEAERGEVSMGLDNLEKYAAFFGVEFYEMSNPEFPLPDSQDLPSASRKAIARLRKATESAAEEMARQKAEAKQAGKPGRSKQLYALIDAGYFKKPRTVKDAFHKLNRGTASRTLTPDEQTELGRITATLSQGKFLHLLDKLDPEPGSTPVRFLDKAPATVPYPETLGHTGMAADKP